MALPAGLLWEQLYSIYTGGSETPRTVLHFCEAQHFCVTAEISKTSEFMQPKKSVIVLVKSNSLLRILDKMLHLSCRSGMPLLLA